MDHYGFFLTTKNEGLLIERTRCERKKGKLFREINSWREPNGKSTGYEYLGFVMLINQQIFLIGIFETYVARMKISFCQIMIIKIC
jgi:hypothetical protein